jgi:hypothetical protein
MDTKFSIVYPPAGAVSTVLKAAAWKLRQTHGEMSA